MTVRRGFRSFSLIAIGMLGSCGAPPERLGERGIEFVRALDGAESDDRFEEVLRQAILFEQPVVRAHAARVLGRRGWRGDVGILSERLEVEEDPEVERAIVEAMAWVCNASGSFPELLEVAVRGSPALRSIALRALGCDPRPAAKGGPPFLEDDGHADDVAEVVRLAVRDEIPEIRRAAALVLAARPGLRVPISDLDALFDAREPENTRWVAMQALAARPDIAQQRETLCVTSVLDRNFLVSFHATRALELFDEVRGLEEVCALLRDERRPWRARLGAARLVESWMRRRGDGRFRALDSGQRTIVSRAVLAVGRRLLASDIDPVRTPVPLARAIGAALEVVGTTESAACSRDLESRFAAAFHSTPAPIREVSGAGRQSLVELHPVLDPPPRGPRVLFLAEGLHEIVLELFLENAPGRVGALLEMVRRGHFSRVRLEPHEDPVGIVLEPTARDSDFALVLARREPSSLRILAGTVVEMPGETRPGRFLIALRPLPEWEGKATVVGRVLLGQQELPFLHAGTVARLDLP